MVMVMSECCQSEVDDENSSVICSFVGGLPCDNRYLVAVILTSLARGTPDHT